MSFSDRDSMTEKTVQPAVRPASLPSPLPPSTTQQPQAPRYKPPFTSQPSPESPSSAPTSSQHSVVSAGQQVLHNVTPLLPLESLPTIAGRGSETFLADQDIDTFLREDLDLSRLNNIHTHLWMAGRPMRARPLHRYKMYGYEVLGTQQMDLHLLRFSNKIFVKPLPEYLLSTSFWEEHLCAEELLWQSAAGWLLSYVWLITSPLDLKLAHDNTLLPPAITWSWWKAFVIDFLENVDIDTLHQVNKRYHFGDLRLSRINSIYRTRFFFTHFVRGYLYGYNRYVVFFERNFSWILIAFVFLSLSLSAMQVGTSLDELSGNYAFMRVSLITVVLSILSVAAVLGAVAIVFSGIFLFNMVSAMRHAGSEQKKRKKLRRNKEPIDEEV